MVQSLRRRSRGNLSPAVKDARDWSGKKIKPPIFADEGGFDLRQISPLLILAFLAWRA